MINVGNILNTVKGISIFTVGDIMIHLWGIS